MYHYHTTAPWCDDECRDTTRQVRKTLYKNERERYDDTSLVDLFLSDHATTSICQTNQANTAYHTARIEHEFTVPANQPLKPYYRFKNIHIIYLLQTKLFGVLRIKQGDYS